MNLNFYFVEIAKQPEFYMLRIVHDLFLNYYISAINF